MPGRAGWTSIRWGEQDFGRYLHVPGVPDMDLLIRTSGERRISNFQLWQIVYAELVFDEVLWPDFDRHGLWRAVEEYALRDRRSVGVEVSPTTTV
ncbi:undecaprenyl diphosphate synthase family protein [Lentzea sp. BCCO 10_0798]|uniref:Undecaprenyl diphosphate synthase family protein n=1 Tax=Lentzea kristufekii TaxID=3095430 RepID=A0ABU4TJU5_9PSEU|nr:undecaprenyl diphosphate synthase family protein [Lentzea sp. BCCO 10_0798]MDX8048534.1 undecaprenyl diphosphate synthase family protein [Lentzea sp. BCCO 10_0798]